MQTTRATDARPGDLPSLATSVSGQHECSTEQRTDTVRHVSAPDIGSEERGDREPNRGAQFGGDLAAVRQAEDALRTAVVGFARAFARHREWLAGRDTLKPTTTEEVQRNWRPLYDAETGLMKAAIELFQAKRDGQQP